MAGIKSPAMRRYLKRLTTCMAVYVVLIFSVGWLFRHAPPTGALAWGAAVLPALPILATFWTIFRLLEEETDEYIRHMLVRQSLFATAFCLSIMTVWEFLQNYDVVPAGTGGFGAAFFWFVGLGIGGMANAFAMRRDCADDDAEEAE
jgi:preprotein translocase subunit SecY